MYIWGGNQKGEISLTLALLGVLISVLGISLGVVSIQQQQSLSASADEFPYESIMEIRDEGGAIVNFVPGLRWQNNFQGTTNNGDINTNGKATIMWSTTSVPTFLRNQSAAVTISPAAYTVVGTFCEDRQGTTCQGKAVSGDLKQISNLIIARDAKITYGWIVAGGARPTVSPSPPTLTPTLTPTPSPTPTVTHVPTLTPPPTLIPTLTPTPTGIPPLSPSPNACPVKRSECTPTNVKVVDIVDNIIQIKWDKSLGCTHVETEDTYWVDIVRNDGSNKIICSSESFDSFRKTRSFCFLGNPLKLNSTRQLDTSSIEFTSQRLVENMSYTVNVHLYDTSHTCTSFPGSKAFTFSTPTPQELPDKIDLKYRILQLNQSSERNALSKLQEFNPGSVVDRNQGEHTNNKVYTWSLRKDENRNYYTMSFWMIEKDKTLSPNKNSVLSALNVSPELQKLCSYGPKIEIVDAIDHAGFRCTFTYESLNTFVQNAKKSNVSDVIDIYMIDKSLSNDNEYQNRCKHVKGKGEYRILFTGDQISSENLLRSVLIGEDILEKSNVTTSGLYDKLTFIMYDDPNINHGCYITQGGVVACDGSLAESLKSVCRADTSVIVSDVVGTANASAGSARISYDDFEYRPSVFTHELGHAIAYLSDEYNYSDPQAKPAFEGVNCTNNEDGLKGCQKWAGIDGCFKGCTSEQFYRPSENSVMRHDFANNNFNNVSINQWKKILTPFNLQGLNNLEDATYFATLTLELDQTGQNQLKLIKHEIIRSYPDKPNLVLSETFLDSYYTIKLIGTGDTILYTTQYLNKDIQLHNPTGESKLKDKLRIFLPYFPNAKKVLIQDSAGADVLSIPLTDDITIPTFSGNLCGNSVCDAALGEDENSCRVDCGAHLVQSEPERADLDGNNIINGQDLSELMSSDVYLVSTKGDINGDGKTNVLDYTLMLKWLGDSVGIE